MPSLLPPGHSLGGAIASLAALELAKHFPSSQLHVYTFGQPRVGNRCFAAEYQAKVPDHWSVVNDQARWATGAA
jgi:predicted lipase